jgi:hypothetical protein
VSQGIERRGRRRRKGRSRIKDLADKTNMSRRGKF